MWRRTLLFLLLPVLVAAETEYSETLIPDAVLIDGWQNVGGADKVTSVTDAVDANYVETDILNDTIKFSLSNPTHYRFGDRIDSAIVHTRAQESPSQTTQIRVRIHNQHTGGVAAIIQDINTTTSWVDYNAKKSELGDFNDDNTDPFSWAVSYTDNNREVGVEKFIRVTACSVVVYYTRENIYYPTFAEGCRAGDNAGKTLVDDIPVTTDTIKIVVPQASTENDYYTTLSGVPNNADWETGAFTLHLNVVKQVNPCSVEVRINRVDASNCATVNQSSSFSTKATISGTGEKTISIPSMNWTAGSTGDRMQIHMRWTNAIGQSNDTLWFTVGNDSNTYIESEVTNLATDYFTSLRQVNCALGDTLIVDDTTAAQQDWVNSGGANKVASVTDEDDGTFVYWASGGSSQRFTFADNTISDAASIDTIDYQVRAIEFDNSGPSNNRIKIQAGTTNTTNFCITGNISLSTSWAWYGFKLTGSPDGAPSCTATLDTLRLDSLEVQINKVSVGAGDSLAVSRIELHICYTATGGAEPAAARRRRMLIGQKDKELREFEQMANVNCDPVIGFYDSRSWLWTNNRDTGLREPDFVLRGNR